MESLESRNLLKEIRDLLIKNNNLQQATFEYVVNRHNNHVSTIQRLREFELGLITEENKKNANKPS